MKDSEILTEEQIFLDIEEKSQKHVFNKIAEIAKELGFIEEKKKLVKAFKEREKESTTGFGDGFAIPHARDNNIKKLGIFFLRLNNGVKWKALDGNPVRIVIALIVPKEHADTSHLALLSKVAQKIIKPEVQKIFTNSKNKNEIIKELM